jgi:hypothetical protein
MNCRGLATEGGSKLTKQGREELGPSRGQVREFDDVV